MTGTVYIHGFPCKNCTDIDLAAKDIDPQHPAAGPQWLQPKKGPDGQPIKTGPDGQPEKIGAKIRDGSMEKIPYLLIVGEKEQAAGTVSLRDESIKEMKERDVGSFSIADVIARFKQEVDEKRIRQISTATAGLAESDATKHF